MPKSSCETSKWIDVSQIPLPSWWWIVALGLGVFGLIAVAGVIIYEEGRKQELMILMG